MHCEIENSLLAEETRNLCAISDENESIKCQVQQDLADICSDYEKERDEAERLRALTESYEDKIALLMAEKKSQAVDYDAHTRMNLELQNSLACTTKRLHEMETSNSELQGDLISATQTRRKWENERLAFEHEEELRNVRMKYALEMEEERYRLTDRWNQSQKLVHEAKNERKEVTDERDRLQGKVKFLEEHSTRLKNRVDALELEHGRNLGF